MLYLLKTLMYIDALVAAGLLVFRWALVPRYRPLVSGKLAAIMLTTPAIALLGGNVYRLFLYLVLVVAFNSRSRLELAGVFLVLLPSVPLLSIETEAAGTYLFAFSTVVAMGFGALIGTALTRPRGPHRLLRYDLAVLFLIGLFTFIDNRFAGGTVVLRSVAANALNLAPAYLLVSRAARNLEDVEQLLVRWSLGAVVMAVAACFQAQRHWVLYEAYNQAMHVPLGLGSAATALRAGLLQTGGSMVNYSAGGLFLAGVIVAIPLLRRCFGKGRYEVILAIVAGGLIATQSRGAWLAAGVGWAVVALWQRRGRQILLLGGAALALRLVSALLPASSRLAQVLGTSGHAQETANYRRDLAAQGLAQVRAHPLFGQPSVQLTRNLSDLTQGQHIVDFVNSHLFVAMRAGIPLCLVWCAIWLMPVIDGFRQNRQPLFIAAPVGIAATAFVALTFTSLVDRNMSWLMVALALSTACARLDRYSRGTRYRSLPPRQGDEDDRLAASGNKAREAFAARRAEPAHGLVGHGAER
jgi:hypothetical protein